MAEEVVIEWKYEPKDYFGDEIIISNENYIMNIADGLIKARVNPELFYSCKDLMSELHKQIEIIFFKKEVVTLKNNNRYGLKRSME